MTRYDETTPGSGGEGTPGVPARAALEPPPAVVRLAEQVASSQPSGRCVKSLRGAVLYDRTTLEVVGAGFNSPPPPLGCTGTPRCREVCRHICAHAEERAVDQALLRVGRDSAPGLYERRVDDWCLELVHVKVGEGGRVVPSGPPSCGQCSKRVLDARVVAGVWLYEQQDGPPRGVDVRLSIHGAPGVAATIHAEVASGWRYWRYYPVLEFHRLSLEAEGWADLGPEIGAPR